MKHLVNGRLLVDQWTSDPWPPESRSGPVTRILVTGSRNWADRVGVYLAIDRLVPIGSKLADVVIIHGDAPGADQAARLWADFMGVKQEKHSADWSLGRKAGPLRNQEMVDSGADVVIAFPLGESRGTRDCMRRAEAAGIRVLNYGDVGPRP